MTPRTATSPQGAVTFHVVAPPYTGTRLVSGNTSSPSAIALGSLLWCGSVDPLEGTVCAVIALRRWPWIIPCVGVREGDGRAEWLIAGLVDEPQRVARLPLRHAVMTSAAIIEQLRAAVERPAPTPALFAAYVVGRLGESALCDPLTEQFRAAFNSAYTPPRSVATYSRAFSRYGPFTARDWRSVARLSLEGLRRAAQRYGAKADVPKRTVSDLTFARYARKFLRQSWNQGVPLVGWEWVLERALRVAGYVS